MKYAHANIASLLSVNVPLLFHIAIKSFSNIFCDIQLGFALHFK